MRTHILTTLDVLLVVTIALVGCASKSVPEPGAAKSTPRVLAVESFLADMAQNVAGTRLHVETLMPGGLDPHSYEPTPEDVRKVTDCDVLIVNGAGLESFLAKILDSAGGRRRIVEASAGLSSRVPQAGEATQDAQHQETDPHFWLDPTLAVTYVNNIRAALSDVDPEGQAIYAANAEAYIMALNELDKWVQEQVRQVPAGQRQLVTNHESLGYWADRYGFTIVGAVIPSVSSEASPSAQQMARLVERVKADGVKAIFVETGANAQLAEQIGAEAGVQIVTDLYTHSTSEVGGPAPTYIEMIRYNTRVIVQALK